MASIPPVNSTTLEGAVLELALKLQERESNELKNPSKLNAANITVDTDQKVATIAIALPVHFVPGVNGGKVIASAYLID